MKNGTMTSDQVAELLGVNRRTLYQWIEKGVVHAPARKKDRWGTLLWDRTHIARIRSVRELSKRGRLKLHTASLILDGKCTVLDETLHRQAARCVRDVQFRRDTHRTAVIKRIKRLVNCYVRHQIAGLDPELARELYSGTTTNE